MDYQIDDRLAQFSANIWKPLDVVDEELKNVINADGSVSLQETPYEGPETGNERFFTMVWNSAKPSRWFAPDEMKTQALLTPNGQLVGDIGFDFKFVADASQADGRTAFAHAWGMD